MGWEELVECICVWLGVAYEEKGLVDERIGFLWNKWSVDMCLG